MAQPRALAAGPSRSHPSREGAILGDDARCGRGGRPPLGGARWVGAGGNAVKPDKVAGDYVASLEPGLRWARVLRPLRNITTAAT